MRKHEHWLHPIKIFSYQIHIELDEGCFFLRAIYKLLSIRKFDRRPSIDESSIY